MAANSNGNEVLARLLNKDDNSHDYFNFINEDIDMLDIDLSNNSSDLANLIKSMSFRFLFSFFKFNLFLIKKEERMEKMLAEDIAEDKKRRLAVAQQQLAEYASQKELDAIELQKTFESLDLILNELMDETEEMQQKEELRQKLIKVKNKIVEQCEEAKAFATQQRTDMDKTNNHEKEKVNY